MTPWLPGWLGGRTRVATAGGLADYLATRAAFVTQKSTTEYMRLRAGLSWEKLVEGLGFAAEIERCRWESYALLLGDVAEVALVLLRQRGAQRLATAERLGLLAKAALDRHPPPAHRADWDDATAAIQARLARAMLAPPRPVRLIGHESALQVFDLLPIRTNLYEADREVIDNHIRFLMCRIHADMELDLDAAGLVAILDAAPVPVVDEAAPPPSGRDG